VSSMIKSPKDFWTGAIYIAFGATALWLGWEYRLGTAGRMGPGYFPKVLAWILIGLGAVSLGRSFIANGDVLTGIAWKPMFLVLLACAAFGYLLAPFGLIVALLALCLISAAASREFRFDIKATLGLIGLVIFCALVFVKGLGVPMPLLGARLEPIVGPFVPWLR
jgi:Tripartite tricarboxylate transporter TctB family